MTITLNCDFVLFFHLGRLPLSSFCLYFSVLQKSASSSALERGGLMKKFSSALQCSTPAHQNLILQGVPYVCCMHPTVVAEPLFPSDQSSAVTLLACCGQCLVPVLLVGQSGVSLGLS